jgi:hypothetical protein
MVASELGEPRNDNATRRSSAIFELEDELR